MGRVDRIRILETPVDIPLAPVWSESASGRHLWPGPASAALLLPGVWTIAGAKTGTEIARLARPDPAPYPDMYVMIDNVRVGQCNTYDICIENSVEKWLQGSTLVQEEEH